MSVTPFVFISHASADKQRLRHLIEALLAADLKVWIDNPAAAGFTEEQVKTFLRIRAGGRWEDEIDKAKREAACILVCWSKHAIHDDVIAGKSRLTWLGEADYGRVEDKLVSCTIDDVDPAKLPGTHSAQQIACVDPDQPPEALRAVLATLIADIKSKISERLRSNSRRGVLRDPFAPYLADRVEQEMIAYEAITSISQSGGTRPIFIAAPENERPDEFFQRICLMSSELLPEGHCWSKTEVEWPHACPPRQFLDVYRRNLWFALRRSGQIDDGAIAAGLEAKGVPSVIMHRMQAGEWTTDEPERIRNWLKFWQTLQHQQPRLRVVPWLQLKMLPAKPGWRECPAGPSNGRVGNREIWKSMTAFSKKAEAGAPLEVPPILSPILFGDADRWINKIQPDAGPVRDRLETTVKALYGGAHELKHGVSHQEFAQTLLPLFADP